MSSLPAQPDDNGSDDAPVVIAEKSFRALHAIRHLHLLESMFQSDTLICRTAASALIDLGRPEEVIPPYVHMRPEDHSIAMPPRLVHLTGTDRATIQLAVGTSARLTIIEGKALLEKVKLSFIKSMSVVALLVYAYQVGVLKNVKPLLVALERKGFEMPPPEQMAAIRSALDDLRERE